MKNRPLELWGRAKTEGTAFVSAGWAPDLLGFGLSGE